MLEIALSFAAGLGLGAFSGGLLALARKEKAQESYLSLVVGKAFESQDRSFEALSKAVDKISTGIQYPGLKTTVEQIIQPTEGAFADLSVDEDERVPDWADPASWRENVPT